MGVESRIDQYKLLIQLAVKYPVLTEAPPQICILVNRVFGELALTEADYSVPTLESKLLAMLEEADQKVADRLKAIQTSGFHGLRQQ